ncbi:MAG: NUDIX domain-containing protein [Clostridiales bacterium]|nr:NUDIX domain-containing protein [Clostridiales bacterium]
MTSKIYPLGSAPGYRYVVIFARFRGQWLFVRHKNRDTWEQPGGHVEPGEAPDAAARRELYEETGAIDFTLRPLFDYWASDEDSSSFGAVFLAEVRMLGGLPPFEIGEVRAFDRLPDRLTYPDITPLLFAKIGRGAVCIKPDRAV